MTECLVGWYLLPDGVRVMVDVASLVDDSYRLIRIGDRPIVLTRTNVEEMIQSGRLTRI